jgi:hypothetical protein
MNERIQELSDKAKKSVPHGISVDKWIETYNEKFAELIVRECARVLTQHGTYFSGEGEPYHYAASLIEEHFGVKNEN